MAATTVRTVMTKDVVSVRALTTYKAIARILYENDISAVPVVDADHRVQGVVSEADLIEKQAQLVREHAEPRRPTGRRARRARTKARAASAAALMSGPAITVRPEANLATAAWLMSTHNVKRLPVVDADGRLIGIVSRGDLLAAILRSDGEIHDEVLNGVL
ncbi:MAG: CBS domain-containing protein, partial [Actinocrinis sp.]